MTCATKRSKGSNAALAFTAAEQLGAVNVAGGDVGAGASEGVFMFHVDWPPRSRQKGRSLRCLAWMVVFSTAHRHAIARSQGFILPTALVKVEDATGLDGESGVASTTGRSLPRLLARY